MAERNLDFDTVTDRRNTNSLKFDFAKRRNMPEDILPLWAGEGFQRINVACPRKTLELALKRLAEI